MKPETYALVDQAHSLIRQAQNAAYNDPPERLWTRLTLNRVQSLLIGLLVGHARRKR